MFQIIRGCESLFDFIKKRINKTIKDASDVIPEEELGEPEAIEENMDETNNDNLEDNATEENNLLKDNESNEEEKEEEHKSRFNFFKRNKKDDTDDEEKDDEDETIESEEEEVIEENIKIFNESEEDEDTAEDNDKEEEHKSRFSFFRRNKNKDNKEDNDDENIDDDTELENEDTEDETLESGTDNNLDENLPEEIDDVDIDESDEKEENKGHFGFLKRNKNNDEKHEDETLESEDEEESSGRFSFITKKTIKEDDIEEIIEELELSLIEGDVAFDVAEKIVTSVKDDLIGRKIKRRGDMELFTTNALKKAIAEIIDNGSYDLLSDIEKSKQEGEPYKIMFVGINGTGKTTTIAKLATYLNKHGYTSVFGASDTFRAGAIEQLEHHAKNLNLKIIKHERNSDPAAVAFDAVEHARATGKDVVLIDTSGRMQTNTNLMDEMKKIKRVSKPDIIIYVGDALMGNDATEQASKFNEVIDIDGIILTKADADAKGGAAISIGHIIHKPILFVGTGQSYDDLMEFEPEWMINQIFEEEATA